MNFQLIEKHQGKILAGAAVLGVVIAVFATQIPGFIKPVAHPTPTAVASAARVTPSAEDESGGND